MEKQRSNPKKVSSLGRTAFAAFCAICFVLVAGWMFSKVQIPGVRVTVQTEQDAEALLKGEIHDLKPIFFQAAVKFAEDCGIPDSALFFCSMSVFLEYEEFAPDSTLLAAYNEVAPVRAYDSRAGVGNGVRVVMDALPQWIRDPNQDEVVLRPSCWAMLSSENFYFRGQLVLIPCGSHEFLAEFLPVTELRRPAIKG